MSKDQKSPAIPLSFEDALFGLLAVDPKKIAKPAKKAAAKKKTPKNAAKKRPAK